MDRSVEMHDPDRRRGGACLRCRVACRDPWTVDCRSFGPSTFLDELSKCHSRQPSQGDGVPGFQRARWVGAHRAGLAD